MNRPVLYWILFTLCLLLIIPAMGWLTYSAMDLNRQILDDRRQTELARREAELQEKITSALYRMDWKLGPHIAREAAQPHYLYESFYNVPLQESFDANQASAAKQTQLPSPLLYEDAEFVKLHFQVGADGVFTSPKRPTSQQQIQQAANCCNVGQTQILACDSRLKQISQFSSFQKLIARIGDNRATDDESPRQSELVYSPAQIEEFVLENEARINAAPVPQQSFDLQVVPGISKSKLQNLRVQDRGGKEFLKRKDYYDDNTLQWAQTQRAGVAANSPPLQRTDGTRSRTFVEGVMRPVWIDGELLLVRKVSTDDSAMIQGCWLDWEKIQQTLRDEVNDIIPEIQFEPLLSSDRLIPGRALATLPVQVVVDTPSLLESLAMTSPAAQAKTDSGVPLALLLAWIGLAFSATAIGLLLYGVIRLSERRASFVSAVTHELRTPLTTFKMYSEMLADQMVPPEKQQDYANTLSQQADRLSHLVENVLQFARLERGANGNSRSQVVLTEELPRIIERLQQRCKQSGMLLDVQLHEHVQDKSAKLELHSLEQILFNLIDNACKYAVGATDKMIRLEIGVRQDCLQFRVRDFGPGIDPKFRRRLFQPFCKSDQEAANSAQGVGLGLALCQRMAKELGGKLECQNVQPGAEFVLSIPTE